jgi:molybdate transport system substrate-binding protein
LFQRLGIADSVLPKSCTVEGGERVGAVVARGEAEIGFQQISELLPVDGIDFVGPLPAEVQRITIFSAGVGAGSTNPAVAKTLIEFLTLPQAIRIIRRTSLEPVAVDR